MIEKIKGLFELTTPTGRERREDRLLGEAFSSFVIHAASSVTGGEVTLQGLLRGRVHVTATDPYTTTPAFVTIENSNGVGDIVYLQRVGNGPVEMVTKQEQEDRRPTSAGKLRRIATKWKPVYPSHN